MFIMFELSMPNIGSWNGKWSSEGNLHAIVRKFNKKQDSVVQTMLKEGYYHYNFGDGWGAGITIKEIDAYKSRRIKRISKGFCGYEWMVDSIIRYGIILNSSQRKKLSTNKHLAKNTIGDK